MRMQAIVQHTVKVTSMWHIPHALQTNCGRPGVLLSTPQYQGLRTQLQALVSHASPCSQGLPSASAHARLQMRVTQRGRHSGRMSYMGFVDLVRDLRFDLSQETTESGRTCLSANIALELQLAFLAGSCPHAMLLAWQQLGSPLVLGQLLTRQVCRGHGGVPAA